MFPAIRQALFATLMPPLPVAVKNVPEKCLSATFTIFVSKRQDERPIICMNDTRTKAFPMRFCDTTDDAKVFHQHLHRKQSQRVSRGINPFITQPSDTSSLRKSTREASFRNNVRFNVLKPGTGLSQECLCMQTDRMRTKR